MVKKYSELLKLARETLKSYFSGRSPIADEKIKKKYSKKQACFVTLTLYGDLRGCVGSLEARQELWKDVIENTVNAAFRDSRFPPLKKEALRKVKIEISLLSAPKKLAYKDGADLLKKIKDRGVIIKKGWNSATYLPQVWEEIKDTEDFMTSLCIKAGLDPMDWLYERLEVQTYEAEKIEED